MKFSLLFLAICFSNFAFAGSAVVDVTLSPAGSFKIKSVEVRGFVTKSGDSVSGKNIVVGLRNVQTGISLRDTHTKKHLEVDKFPEAILVEASGKGGKGQGTIKIRGIEKKFKGTYKIEGKQLIATFPLKISYFKIKDLSYMGVSPEDDITVTVTVPIH
jgi:hypothetical protein